MVAGHHFEQCRCLRCAQRLDVANAPGDRPGAPASLINGALGGVGLLAELVPNVAILDELRLCEAEYLPHLARPLLDGQRPKAHLQAGEEGGKGGRSVLRLQLAGEARAADHLGE
jgi:hypothetical protein